MKNTEELKKYLNDESCDPIFKDAVKLVVEEKRASTTLLQRTFMLGYARASRLIVLMEQLGFIGAADREYPLKPREIFITNEIFDMLFS